MLVMNDGFYLLRYRGQGRFSPVILRWILSTEDSSGVVRSEDAYELFRPEKRYPPPVFIKSTCHVLSQKQRYGNAV